MIFSRAVDVISYVAQRPDKEPAQIELAANTTFSAIVNSLKASTSTAEKLFNKTYGSASDLEKVGESINY